MIERCGYAKIVPADNAGFTLFVTVERPDTDYTYSFVYTNLEDAIVMLRSCITDGVRVEQE